MDRTSENTVFVGREKELERAKELIRAAKAGGEAVCCIEAGPGMGKTALVQRIGERAREEGVLVVNGAFVDGQELPPLWPWRSMLIKALRYLENNETATDIVERFSPLVSSPEAGWGSAPELAELPAAERKFRFFELVGEFFHDLSKRTPVALVLEDLHAGDDDSLHLLSYLTDVLQFDSVFLLLTWRPEEDQGKGRTVELKKALRYLRSAAILPIEGFTREELRRYLLLESIEVGEDETEQAHAWTNGIPLQAWLYAKRLKAGMEGPQGRRASSPPTELLWLDEREELSPAARETAGRLALIGNSFTQDEALLVCPAAADGTGVLEELLGRGLIRSETEGQNLHFFHDELRLVIMRLMREDELASRIDATTTALEKAAANTRRTRLLKELYLTAAENRLSSGNDTYDLKNGIVFILEAIASARAQNAWHSVIADTERLLDLFEDRLQPETVLDLKIGLCTASHHAVFREPFYTPMAAELLRNLRASGDVDRYCTLLCNFHFHGIPDGVHTITDFLEDLLSKLPVDDARRGEVQVRSAREEMITASEPGGAAKILDQALSFARERGDALTEASAMMSQARISVVTRRFSEGLEIARQVSSIKSAMLTESVRTEVLDVRLWANMGLGRLSEAEETGREILSLERLYGTRLGGLADIVRTRFPLMKGDWSHLSLEQTSVDSEDFLYMFPRVIGAYLRGEVERADRVVATYRAQIDRYGLGPVQIPWFTFCWVVGIRAYLSADTKWVDEASTNAVGYLEKGHPHLIALASFPVSVARMSRVRPVGEVRGRACYELLIESSQYYYEEEEYTIAAGKALLAESWGDTELAARHFEEAIGFCDKYGEKPWRAHYLFELALLHRSADPERAQRLVAESRQEAERLSLAPLLERIRADWDEATSEAGESAAGITRRELQVLECLAEGLTDKEIALFLKISPHTVGNHLRHIYEKTQSVNRGEAVHWAISNGLVRIDRVDPQ